MRSGPSTTAWYSDWGRFIFCHIETGTVFYFVQLGVSASAQQRDIKFLDVAEMKWMMTLRS
jgi:hypothetical protein